MPSPRILRRGCSGSDVTAWQHFLIGRTLLTGAADGIFGPGTDYGTRYYQQDKKLDNDGVVGNATLAKALQDGFAIVPDVDDDTPKCPPGFRALANNAARAAKFGAFKWKDRNNKAGEIEIQGNWVEKNIVQVICPRFRKKVSLHKQVADDYLGFMNELIDSDLAHLLLTHEGAFYPRYIRGSKTSLSNHSWGTAFDVNYEWNQLGSIPARPGTKGSVRELVMIGVKWGWYWGGWFSRRDGMHFEHV